MTIQTYKIFCHFLSFAIFAFTLKRLIHKRRAIINKDLFLPFIDCLSTFHVTISFKHEYNHDSIFIRIVFQTSSEFVLAHDQKLRNRVLFVCVFEGQKTNYLSFPYY